MSLTRRNPGLARLIAAQVPADFADWLGYMAITALLAFVWQAPPIAFAWFGVALGLPYLVVGPVAGALVDRWPLRSVLVASNLGRGLGALGLIAAPSWPWLVAVVALIGAVDSFFTPAKQAAIQALVAPEDRMAANGLSGAVNQASKVAGPALGGALVAIWEVDLIFVLNAGVSLVAAALFLGLVLPPQPTAADRRTIRADIRDGVTIVRRTPALTAALLISAGVFFAIFLYDTFIPKLSQTAGFGPGTFGLSMAAVGGGAILGSLLAGRVAGRGPFLWIAAALALNTVLIGGLGLVGQGMLDIGAWAFVATFAVIGTGGAFVQVPLRTAVQNAAAPGTLARVTSLTEAASMAALLVAPFGGALLAAAFGIGAPFLAGAALCLALAAATLRHARRLA